MAQIVGTTILTQEGKYLTIQVGRVGHVHRAICVVTFSLACLSTFFRLNPSATSFHLLLSGNQLDTCTH